MFQYYKSIIHLIYEINIVYLGCFKQYFVPNSLLVDLAEGYPSLHDGTKQFRDMI